MDEILLYLVKHLSFLYKDFGFKIVNSGHYEHFAGNGFVVLQSGDLKVQIAYDGRDKQFSFDVHNLKFCKKSYDWYSVDILWQLVKGEIFVQSKEMEAYDVNDLNDGPKIFENIVPVFLKEHIATIVEYLTGEDAEENFKKMRLMEKARAKRLFG